MPGTLYVVATPIGNLSDITLRALDVLKEVSLIAAEDTRVTRVLLDRYGIETRTTPYHQHSLDRKARQLLDILQSGDSVALVSDAGTPGISDPGHEIIGLAISEDIPVVVIPGPSAIITALVASGLPTRRFVFEGFPPRKTGERRAFFQSLRNETRTTVFYESPHRLLAVLKDMHAAFGDRRIAVIREATKMFEEVFRGGISDAVERFTTVKARGELTIVLAGAAAAHLETTPDQIEASLRLLLEAGESERDAVREVAAEFSVPKKEVYRRMILMKESSEDD